MRAEERLENLGIKLPVPGTPTANYVSCVQDGNIIYLSGHGPFKDGKPAFTGKLGRDLSVEDGYQAARLCAIGHLGVLKAHLGDLDRVDRILKLLAFVASADGFTEQSKVVNGASDLLVEVFGERGRHARSAIGTSQLPLDIPVEIEMIVRIRG